MRSQPFPRLLHLRQIIVGIDPTLQKVLVCGACFNSLTTYLPHLLSLSASSPFFADADTGLASCRVKIFESLPTAGLPYRFRNWAEFQRLMITLVNARAIESVREIWWDIRPHPDFGTIEVRICDGLPTLNDVIAMTALVQALIVWLGDQYDAGMYLPVQRHWIVRENKWRAARWAVDADIIVDEEGRLERLSDSILGLVETLRPTARRLRSEGELSRVEEMLRVGPSYRRQRRVHAESGSFDAVMDALVREFRENAPVVDALNRKIKADERVTMVMLPIGDGLTICHKQG